MNSLDGLSPSISSMQEPLIKRKVSFANDAAPTAIHRVTKYIGKEEEEQKTLNIGKERLELMTLPVDKPLPHERIVKVMDALAVTVGIILVAAAVSRFFG